MKKVGIMSMQRVENYGSFLQAYGLKKMIESLGFSVTFVDYQKGKSLVGKKKQFLEKIKRNANILEFVKRRKIKNALGNMYRERFLPRLDVSDSLNINPKNIDTLVIGSDEVFNPIQPDPSCYSKELFGYNYEDVATISYAACFGYCTLDDLKKYKIADEIGEMLKKFKSISVRDDNSFDIVKTLTGSSPAINLDPVLMYDFADEKRESSLGIKDYIVLYAYPGRFTRAEEREIKRLARKYKKTIVSVGFYQKIADVCVVPDAFEIFNLFKKADFVITDTFHGTIFSIKENVNFCSMIRGTHVNKLGDLLERVRLSDRKIKDASSLEKMFLNAPDFGVTNGIIENEKAKAMNYLRGNI